MPSISRVIFVSVPFLLTIGTLVGLLLTYTGNISDNSIAQTFWFFGIDTSKAQYATVSGASTTTLPNLPGWYVVGLWNYCSGPSSSTTPSFCSNPTFGYFFNPIKVFDLPSDVVNMIPSKYVDSLDTMKALSKWASTAYLIAIILAVVTLPISILAFKRRLGSFLAACVSAATCLFTIGASTAATIMYATLFAIVKEGFGGEYNMTPALSKHALAATWYASISATVAFFFWLFTACCCRGRVAGKEVAPRSAMGDKYQPVSFPGPQQTSYNAGYPMQNVEAGNKFEPYRH